MGEQQASRQTGLAVLAPHADDGATRPVRIIVDQVDQIFLPVEQLEWLPNKLTLGNEAHRLDEFDDVGRADPVADNLLSLPSFRHVPSP
jgi:hypothetical protein